MAGNRQGGRKGGREDKSGSGGASPPDRLIPRGRRCALTEREYSLAELSETSVVPARTIRFYIQRGLLPRPLTKGPKSLYSLEHLHKLMAIKRLKDEGFSLDAIGRAFEEVEEQLPETLFDHAPEEEVEEFRRRERRLLWSRIRPSGSAREALENEQVRYKRSAFDPAAPGRRSEWEHIALTPWIEVHARRPLPSNQRKGLMQLLETAKKLFGEVAG